MAQYLYWLILASTVVAVSARLFRHGADRRSWLGTIERVATLVAILGVLGLTLLSIL